MLVNITAGSDMSIGEFEIVGDTIRDFTSEQATVVVGTVIEPDMQDEMKVTIVVTGLDGATDQPDQPQSKRGFRDGKVPSMQDRLAGRNVLSSTRDWAKSGRLPMSARSPSTTSSESSAESAEGSTNRVIDIPAFLRRQEVDAPEEN